MYPSPRVEPSEQCHLCTSLGNKEQQWSLFEYRDHHRPPARLQSETEIFKYQQLIQKPLCYESTLPVIHIYRDLKGQSLISIHSFLAAYLEPSCGSRLSKVVLWREEQQLCSELRAPSRCLNLWTQFLISKVELRHFTEETFFWLLAFTVSFFQFAVLWANHQQRQMLVLGNFDIF